MAKNTKNISVVDQVIIAFGKGNRLATVMGFLLGGVVPVATYLEAHVDFDTEASLWQLPTLLVLGGLVYSAKTVFVWAKQAFDCGYKALGFVALMEGVMVTSKVPALPLVLLAFLVAINGVASGCTLSLKRSKPKAEKKAQPAPAVNVEAEVESRVAAAVESLKAELAEVTEVACALASEVETVKAAAAKPKRARKAPAKRAAKAPEVREPSVSESQVRIRVAS